MRRVAAVFAAACACAVSHAQDDSGDVHASPCPHGTYKVPVAKHCHAMRMNWTAAQDYCQAMYGTDLATVSSEDTNEYIVENAEVYDGESADFHRRCSWIGYSDIQDEGHWVWSSGLLPHYEAWSSSEPNDCCSEEDHQEDCGASCEWFDGTYKWNDFPCYIELNSFCCDVPEADVADLDFTCEVCPHGTYQDAVTDATSCTQCPDGLTTSGDLAENHDSLDDCVENPCPSSDWLLDEDARKCYMYTGYTETFQGCMHACENLGASLPCPESSDEMRFLASAMNFLPSFKLGIFQYPVGGPAENWDNWAMDGCTSAYRNWRGGEPNDYCEVDEKCVFVSPGPPDWYNDWYNGYQSVDASWYDVACQEAHACVCEYGATSTDFAVRVAAEELDSETYYTDEICTEYSECGPGCIVFLVFFFGCIFSCCGACLYCCVRGTKRSQPPISPAGAGSLGSSRAVELRSFNQVPVHAQALQPVYATVCDAPGNSIQRPVGVGPAFPPGPAYPPVMETSPQAQPQGALLPNATPLDAWIAPGGTDPKATR